MKKSLIVGALALTLGVGSLVAYADTPKAPNIIPGNRNTNFTIEDREAWFKEMTEFRKEEIKRALEKGLITEAETKEWEEHFNYMEEFHNKNGFMRGACHGNDFGMGRGTGFGRGIGMGMMRGNGLGR